jgi:2-amino-4-hydroxy-6-hydroxymethyldihydropteridine diphosphokinase
MTIVYLGLGSNMGLRSENLDRACSLIESELGIITKRSGIYETEPWGMESDQEFLNMAVEIETSLDPFMLLDRIMRIESDMGRPEHKPGYSDRLIDIDILLYNDQIINNDKLEVPHPHLHERLFVLEALAEIAPDHIHPVFGKTVKVLLDRLSKRE